MMLGHGKLKLDVPEGWLDQSTLLFVEPRGDAEPVPARAVTPTLSVRFAARTSLSAKELIEAEISKLELVQPELTRVRAQAFESPLGEGWMIEIRAALADVPVAQLAVAWANGELGVIACAACGARELEGERQRLEGMLRAIRI